MSSSDIPLGGLEEPARHHLTRLHRAFPAPFGIPEAAAELGLDRDRAGRLLKGLASRGWLVRVRRGLYATVPLQANDPGAWLADPWAVAIKTFDPCYIGGWTALHHWGLTEQVFRAVAVFTARSIRSRDREVQGTRFRLRQQSSDLMFGTRRVWRDGVPVPVSDPERTLVDVLDRPDLGGGIRHVVDCLEAWSDRSKPRPRALLDYGRRVGNRTVFKRLGFLLESRGIAQPELVEGSLHEMSTGLSPLDPSSKHKGRIHKRWQLRVNARV